MFIVKVAFYLTGSGKICFYSFQLLLDQSLGSVCMELVSVDFKLGGTETQSMTSSFEYKLAVLLKMLANSLTDVFCVQSRWLILQPFFSTSSIT